MMPPASGDIRNPTKWFVAWLSAKDMRLRRLRECDDTKHWSISTWGIGITRLRHR